MLAGNCTSSRRQFSTAVRWRHVKTDVERGEKVCDINGNYWGRNDISLCDYSDSEEDVVDSKYKHQPVSHLILLWRSFLTALAMPSPIAYIFRWRTNILMLCCMFLGMYIFFLDPYAHGKLHEREAIDYDELEQELENGHPVVMATYKSPLSESLFELSDNETHRKSKYSRDREFESHLSRTLKFHKVWTWADKAITKSQLVPEKADEEQDVIRALQTARIVQVDVLDIGEYESGTSEKWVVTLDGGQKAMMKVVWEDKGTQKHNGQCNFGYEMPTAEIAAYHLHRILQFYNVPYVAGRRVSLRHEVLPVASPAVAKQIQLKTGNLTCLSAKCYYCDGETELCPSDGFLEVSVAYWVPRKLRLYTYPPKYMPWSTPRMEEWGKLPFNDRTYCKKLREIEPYEQTQFYLDLFDFAVIDTLTYHYDSKHYVVNDKSDARGLTVRLDHGRAFCSYDRDEEQVFLAPIHQCCTLRRRTWDALQTVRGGVLSRELRRRLASSPLAPVLVDDWYPALDRRLQLIIDKVERCARENGGLDHVLVG